MVIMANAIDGEGRIRDTTSRKYNNADGRLASEQVDEWDELLNNWDEDVTVDYKGGFPVMIDYYGAHTQRDLWALKLNRSG